MTAPIRPTGSNGSKGWPWLIRWARVESVPPEHLGPIGRGVYSWMNAQYADGIAHCEEALRVAAATGDLELRILGTFFLGVINNALRNNESPWSS